MWSRFRWYSDRLQALARQRRAGIVLLCQASISALLLQIRHTAQLCVSERLQVLETDVALVIFKSKEQSASDLPAGNLRLTNGWRRSLPYTHTHTRHVAASRLQTEKVQIINRKKTTCFALKKPADAVKSQIFPRESAAPWVFNAYKGKNRSCMKERRAPREWHSLRFSVSTKPRKKSRCSARNQTWAHFVHWD